MAAVLTLSPSSGGTTDYIVSGPASQSGTWLSGDDIAQARGIAVQLAFLHGTGSGGVRAYLQGSLDQGATVYDIAIADFDSAARRVMFNIEPVTSSGLIEPSIEGVTGDSPDVAQGIVAPILGDRLRLQVIVEGSYTNTTLAARVTLR